ncbi:DinB family protein [Rhizobium alvei]|uniref:DinB family protein n=1 Tax=Rhizobium alvei TaxID=1132659 RepID=A0ABT8YJ53_9HYPH|nr:DinB family protein [Rhizobium alvei]MDO6963695.1 DinB family protein [Rhizobium alvei]
MKNTFLMFADYNRWANRKVYETVATLSEEEQNRNLGAFFPTPMATLNHILVADRIWMKRLTGQGEAPKALDEILFTDFDGLREARQAQDEILIDYIEKLDETALDGDFSFTPLVSPEPITQKLGPTLSHVFNHQTHHRGQVHMMLTMLGKPSLALDLVYFLRGEEGRKFMM